MVFENLPGTVYCKFRGKVREYLNMPPYQVREGIFRDAELEITAKDMEITFSGK